MRMKIVPISNIARLSAAANALLNRAPGMPGMGIVEGPTGFGKSTGIAWIATKTRGVFVRAQSMSTPTSLLSSICKELGIAKRAGNVDAVDDIVLKLGESNRPLFIDEADYLAKKTSLIEMLRDIHDLASVPVVLIGMHGFKRKISYLQQLTGRVAQSVDFQPATIEDAQALAQELAEVKIGADLVRKLHAETRGSVRLFVNGLNSIEQFAKSNGKEFIAIEHWPANKEFFVGEAPVLKKASIVAIA